MSDLSLPGESWKMIKGYEERYLVSNLGRVMSFADSNNPKILSPITFHKDGYQSVALYTGTGGEAYGTRYQVHRLVLEAFVGPCPPDQECRHLDGNPWNNRLDNLEWGTSEKNKADKLLHGTDNRGEKHVGHVLTERDIVDICMSPETQKEITQRYSIAQSLVSGIRSGKRWPGVPRPVVPIEVLEERKRRERANNRGENRSTAFTTEDVIYIIKRLAADGYGIVSDLANEFGVKHSTIQQIRDRKSWTHIWDHPELAGVSLEKPKSRNLSESDVLAIKRLLQQGESQSQIARDYGVTPQSIQAIASGKAWSHITLNEE